MGSPTNQQVKKGVLKWTYDMDSIFIGAMLEQQVSGNQVADTHLCLRQRHDSLLQVEVWNSIDEG